MRKNKMIKNEPATINLHVRDDSDFLSPYAEEGKPIISTEIADFLEKTIRAYHPKCPVILNIHSTCIDDNEKIQYQKAIRNYFSLELEDNIREMKRISIKALIFTIIGVIILAFMFVLDHIGVNSLWIEVIDIFAWVFLWEAVDLFFIERSHLLVRAKRLQNFIQMQINYL